MDAPEESVALMKTAIKFVFYCFHLPIDGWRSRIQNAIRKYVIELVAWPSAVSSSFMISVFCLFSSVCDRPQCFMQRWVNIFWRGSTFFAGVYYLCSNAGTVLHCLTTLIFRVPGELIGLKKGTAFHLLFSLSQCQCVIIYCVLCSDPTNQQMNCRAILRKRK